MSAVEQTPERASLLSHSPLEHAVDIPASFLPHSPPICRLEEPWSAWEDALDAARGLKPGHGESRDPAAARWRRMIRDELPLVDLDGLQDKNGALPRAHLVLAFLTHFYVHSDEVATEPTAAIPAKVPKALAIPLYAVSQLLDVPPVVTYADTVLYNWRLVNPAEGFAPANIEMVTTFTGTQSEQEFYKNSVLIEGRLGPECLSLIKLSLNAALVADKPAIALIASNLRVLSATVDRLRQAIERVREGCAPAVFFWEMRPWLDGGRREMEGVADPADSERWLVTSYGAPNAGQSTLIHALDVFLGIDHSAGDGLVAAPTSPSSQHTSRAMLTREETFMDRVAVYMPQHHRNFLAQLAGLLAHSSRLATLHGPPDAMTHSIRSLAITSSPTSDIRLAYNAVLAALAQLRTTHSRIALLYVLSQSRQAPPPGSAFIASWQAKMDAEAARPAAPRTGGTELAKFLKRCKERTVEAILDTP